MSSLRLGEGVDGVWQVRQYGLEGAPGVGHAVQKECGNSRWISLLDVGKPDPIRKLLMTGVMSSVQRLSQLIREILSEVAQRPNEQASRNHAQNDSHPAATMQAS